MAITAMKRIACIRSANNERYKLLKALTKSHQRRKHGLFFVETPTLVREVLLSDWQVEWVALTPHFAQSPKGEELLNLAHERGVAVTFIIERLLRTVSALESSPSIIAVVHQRHDELGSINIPSRACIIVLDQVQDPTNVGAVIRVADAVGATAVLMITGTADKYNPKVVRASAGSVLYVRAVRVNSASDAIRWLRAHGFQIIATDPSDGANCFAVEYRDKVALVFGNEARGLSDAFREAADMTVTIPMVGRAESLNIATACAILAYELFRRWRGVNKI